MQTIEASAEWQRDTAVQDGAMASIQGHWDSPWGMPQMTNEEADAAEGETAATHVSIPLAPSSSSARQSGSAS